MNKRSHIVFLIKTFSLRALFFHVYFMFDSCCGVIISFNCLIWCIIVLNNMQKQMTIEIDVTMYICPVSGAFNTITWKKFWKIHNDFIKMVFQKKMFLRIESDMNLKIELNLWLIHLYVSTEYVTIIPLLHDRRKSFFLERGIGKESQRKRDRDRNKSVFHMTTNKFVCVCLIKWKCVLNM